MFFSQFLFFFLLNVIHILILLSFLVRRLRVTPGSSNMLQHVGSSKQIFLSSDAIGSGNAQQHQQQQQQDAVTKYGFTNLPFILRLLRSLIIFTKSVTSFTEKVTSLAIYF